MYINKLLQVIIKNLRKQVRINKVWKQVRNNQKVWKQKDQTSMKKVRD